MQEYALKYILLVITLKVFKICWRGPPAPTDVFIVFYYYIFYIL
jgi:hypothetical protein